MRKFVIKVALFVVPVILFAYLFDYVVSSGLRRTRYGDYSVWNDIFSGNLKADVIILGSSRAMVQASPAILDSAWHVNAYNLGANGYSFRMQLCRFHVYRQHNPKPKAVIHEVDYGTFNDRDDLYEFEQFLPYLKDSTIREFTTHYDGFDFFDYHTPLIGYYSRFKQITFGAAEFFDMLHLKSSKQKGYLGNNFSWDGTFEKAKVDFPEGYRVKQYIELAESFRLYLDECKRDSIQVALVWMPEYIEGQKFVLNRDSVLRMFQGIAKEHQIPFLNYSNDSLCYDKGMFYNSRHLNRRGAEKFTRKMASDLRMLELGD